ncbi:HAD family phosphatase [Dysgonomonas sp. 520]|uniref:HAD family hydrolase n=1 Tax=Dysgonomonas sp. 520 TaxID=2302931 RepID=UPI0013D0112E|nr:HAD family phosphatase [Dysgonomonas sp. 520]NDW09379.1 HAD family phosphatase [Dysgonomonas sp. 520]
MNKDICVLFDMDGVMIDTETQYDVIWKHLGDKYNAGIENFEKVIKGTTLPNILKKYFSHLNENELKSLEDELDKFEASMKFPEIPGSVAFVKSLKDAGFKVGLVTSSTNTKMIGVNKEKRFDMLFDTIVSAERVVKGKPDPECFLLAAKDSHADPQNCIVFEDSFAGIEAATKAGMTVIGVSTTNSVESLKDKCAKVIPNFEELSINDLLVL